MNKAGKIVGIIGSIMMIIGGVLGILAFNALEAQLIALGESFASVGIKMGAIYIAMIVTSILGIIGIIGIVIGKKNSMAGGLILLGVGIFAIIGTFIPIQAAYSITIGAETIPFAATSLSASLLPLWIDPILIIIGGILVITKSED